MKPEEAIKTLDMMLNEFCNEDSWSQEYKDAVDMAIKALKAQLSNTSEIPNSSDLISRQAAIDAIDKALSRTFIEPCGEMILKDLPSVQPEIIHCKECKYAHMTYDGDCKYCDVWFPDESKYVGGDYYCASAERKTDE